MPTPAAVAIPLPHTVFRCARRRRGRVVGSVLLWVTLSPCVAHAVTIRVIAVRVGQAPDRVRLVLEADAPILARIVQPTAPGQMAVDLDDVVTNPVLASLPGKVGRDNPWLRDVRIVGDEAGRARLAFTPRVAMTPQIFQLKPGEGHAYRLVLDFYPDQIARSPDLPTASGVLTDASQGTNAASTSEESAIQASPSSVSSPQGGGGETAVSPNAVPPAVAGAAASDTHEAWLDVTINGTAEGAALVMRDASTAWVNAEDVVRWRLRAPAGQLRSMGGMDYYPLNAFEGLSYRIDESKQLLELTLAATGFETTRFSGVGRSLTEPTPSEGGAYLSYDASAAGGNNGDAVAGALMDVGLFGRWGQFGTTTLLRWGGPLAGTTRLDSTWNRDLPARMATLRFGDAISGASQWGRSLRFGGVQWASNFATQPGLITFPTPDLSGAAVLPSTVDVYVNNALRLRRSVPSGPFSIQDLPVITGQGEVRMVIRDALGREQSVSEPFYASGGLLAPGLRAYSYDLGFARRDYGLRSFAYGTPLLAITERRGITDTFTGELHGEATRRAQTLGAGATWLVPTLGVFTASAAGSQGPAGRGSLLGLGFQRQSARISVGARSQWMSGAFTELGDDPVGSLPRRTTSAYGSVSLSQRASFGVNYTYQRYAHRPDIELVGIGYNRSIGRLGYLGVSALHFLAGQPGTLFSLTYTQILGPSDSMSISGLSRKGSRGGSVQYQRNVPRGSGIGYRLQAGISSDDPSQVGITAQNEVGTYSLDAASVGDAQRYRLGARGSLVLMDGQMFASRRIDDSFAVVHVPGYARVRVYADNQVVGVTNRRGDALVPSLRSYENNPVRIEQADLPLDATIAGLQLQAVPYRHSGVSLTFPVSQSRGALITLSLPNHAEVPAGAEVTVQATGAVFPVGKRGEVYLTGLAPANRLQVRWEQDACVAEVALPESDDPLPRIGPVNCVRKIR